MLQAIPWMSYPLSTSRGRALRPKHALALHGTCDGVPKGYGMLCCYAGVLIVCPR